MPMHLRRKAFVLARILAVQIIQAEMEAPARSNGQYPFQCLRPRLHLFKLGLLLDGAPIRLVPVTVVVLFAALSTRDAPMTGLMQGAGVESVRKYYPIPATVPIRGPILGDSVPGNKHRVMGRLKQPVEQVNRIAVIVRLARLWYRMHGA